MGYTSVKNYVDGYFVWKKVSDSVKISDSETDNILYRKPIQIAKNIYSTIVLLSHLLMRTQTIITTYHSL